MTGGKVPDAPGDPDRPVWLAAVGRTAVMTPAFLRVRAGRVVAVGRHVADVSLPADFAAEGRP